MDALLAVGLPIFIALALGLLTWHKLRTDHEVRPGKRLRDVAVVGKGGGGLACPRCGGNQFEAKKSLGRKLAGVATIGVGAALLPKNQVQCVTCGKVYQR